MENEFRPLYVASDSEDFSKNDESNFGRDPPVALSSAEFYKNQSQNADIKERIEVMYSDRPSAAKLTFSSFNTNLSERKPENLKEKTLNVEDEKLNSGKTIEKKFDDCEKEENEFEVSETFISEVFKSESTDDVKFIEAKVISKEGNVKLIVNEFVNCNDNSRMNDKFYKSSLGSDSETQKEEETLQEFSSDELDVKDPLNDTPFEESEESEKNFKDFEEECKKIDKNTNLETTANNILKENKKSPKTDEDFSVYITSDLHKDVNEKTSFDQSTGVDNCELNVLKINDKDCVNIEQLLNGEADDKIVDLVTFEKCDWLNCSKKEVNNFNNNDIFDSKFDKELNFEKSISPVFTPNVSSLEKIENKEALKETDGQEKKIKNELVGSLMCDESSAKVITSEGNAVMSEDDLFDCVEVLGVTEKNSGEGFTSITESRFINTFTDDAHFEKNKNSPLNSNSFENKNVEEEEENEESTNAKDPKIDEISKALEAIFHENEDDKEKQCRKKPENAVDAKKVDKDVLLSTVTQIPDKNAKPTSNDCKDLCDNRNDILHLKSNSNALNETSATTKETTEISQAKNQKENDDINKSELNQSNKLIISSNESSDDAKKSFSILENDNDKTDLIDSFPIDKDLLNSSDKTNMKNELCLETTDKSDILLQSATATDSIKLADPLPSSQIEKKNVTEVSLEKSEDHCPKISKNKCTNEPKEMRESSINTSANIKKSFCEKQTSRINNFKKSIFDQSKTVERRHSLNESEVSGFVKYQGDNYSTKYISKIKFTYSKWKTRYFKSKSCPPFIKSSSKNELQIEMPILDIPVEEIPLPSGCPPPENCFDLSELKKRKLSNENQNDSKYVQPSNDIEKPKTQLSLEALPLYELSKCEINKNEESEKVFQQNNNKCISKRGKPRNVNSIENCHSPFMLCDFRNCRNPSPPPTGENEKDSMPAASTTNEKISSLSPSDVCCGLTLIKENAQHSENANNTKKLKMTIVEERKTSTETNDLCSESITDICVESRVSELVGAKINYEDSHVKDDNLQKIKNDTDFNFPDFLSHKESKLRTQVTKLNFIEEKQLTDSNNDDKLKEITTNENEFLSNLCSFEGTDSARNSKDVEVRLMDENMDLDENEANDSEKVDFVDDESTTGTGFENDELMRGGFYECEDIPTSEDLPNGNDIEVEKVSDDDKFRHMMQNCLDNAKKFLNVNNLKLFSCSMEDLLELDCQLTDATLEEKEPEKSVDSTNHISRDVLLTSCEKVIGDDLELSENFPPSNLTVDFTPSFESESSNNLCPEILPVDNWPYLEEEVPSSPTKADLEEADLIPFLESSTNQSLLNRSILHTKSESKNGVRSDFCKVINKKKIKRFRRRSLMADDETSLAKSSKISGRRRKTMDALVGNHLSHQKGSGKDINSLKAEITRLKSGLEKIEHLWQNNKDLKCRLSLDRLETSDSLENKYKIRVLPCVRDECKIRCTCKKEEKTLKHNIQNLKNSKINDSYNQVSCNNKNSLEKISSGGRNHPNYKSPIWQPKVMLFRISKKELRKIQEQSYSISRSEIKDEKRSCQSLKQGKGVISQDMESDEFITKKAKVSYNFENDKFDRNSVTDNSQIYVKHFDDSKNCFVQIKGEDKKFEKNVSDKWDENTCEKFSKTELYFCRLARAEKLENRSHRENSTSTKSLFEKSKTDQNLSNIDKEGFITVSPKGPDLIKRKKSRFRNLHSKKRIKSNLSAKDITSSSHNILPKKPTLVDTERVLNEIFKECDQSKEQVLTPRTSGNEFIRNTENKGMDVNVKNKSADVSSILDVPYKKVKSHTENVCHPHDEYCSGLNSKSLNNHSMRERNESSRSEKRREKTHNTVTSRSSDFSVKHRRRELSDSYRHNKTSKKFSSETYRGGHENNEKFRQESEYRERKSCHKHKEKHSAENDGRKEFSNRGKRDSSSDHDISSEKKINNPEKSHRVARSKSSSSEDGFGVREASSERPWMCEVCGFNNASERITHIKDHPFHCQSCHLAFRTEVRFEREVK